MEETIECTSCGWTGDETMLVSATEDLDDRDFIYCPECGKDTIQDIDD